MNSNELDLQESEQKKSLNNLKTIVQLQDYYIIIYDNCIVLSRLMYKLGHFNTTLEHSETISFYYTAYFHIYQELILVRYLVLINSSSVCV